MDPTPIEERQYEMKRSHQRENLFARWRQIFLESSSCEIFDHLGCRILGRSFTLVLNNKVIGSNCIWIHQVPSNPLVRTSIKGHLSRDIKANPIWWSFIMRSSTKFFTNGVDKKWQIQMGTKSKGVDISLLQVWTTHHSFFTLHHMLNNWPVHSTWGSNLLNLSSYTCISSWNIKVPYNPHGTWHLNFHFSFHLDKWFLCIYVFLICMHNVGLGGS
jgi:hypothetical protein